MITRFDYLPSFKSANVVLRDGPELEINQDYLEVEYDDQDYCGGTVYIPLTDLREILARYDACVLGTEWKDDEDLG